MLTFQGVLPCKNRRVGEVLKTEMNVLLILDDPTTYQKDSKNLGESSWLLKVRLFHERNPKQEDGCVAGAPKGIDAQTERKDRDSCEGGRFSVSYIGTVRNHPVPSLSSVLDVLSRMVLLKNGANVQMLAE